MSDIVKIKGITLGYIRVSTICQNTERQLDGIHCDRIFTDKASGKDTNRSQLEAMIDYVRDGDTIKVHSIDRLARNLVDLRIIVQIVIKKNARIEFIKENLSFDGEDTPHSIFMLSIMGSFAEFERAIMKERQREGIILAKKRGAYKGRTPKLNEQQIIELKLKISNGMPKAKICRLMQISKTTLYKYEKYPDSE